jgi:hypothetical protein
LLTGLGTYPEEQKQKPGGAVFVVPFHNLHSRERIGKGIEGDERCQTLGLEEILQAEVIIYFDWGDFLSRFLPQPCTAPLLRTSKYLSESASSLTNSELGDFYARSFGTQQLPRQLSNENPFHKGKSSFGLRPALALACSFPIVLAKPQP